MNEKLRVGQVGIGAWGQYHCKLLSEIDEVNFVGIFDINASRSDEYSKLYNIKHYKELDALINDIDALVITAPTSQHFSIAESALQHNKHVFIEKPICVSVSQAKDLITKAQKNRLTFQVGHIERFNPAFLSLAKEPLEPVFIESRRLAPFSPRSSDVSVVLDLMIHDIDIILKLVKQPVKNIEATGFSQFTNNTDFANARMEFENGCIANTTSSRIAEVKQRTMDIYQKNVKYKLDFQDRTAVKIVATKNENTNGHITQLGTPNHRENNLLKTELDSFVKAAKNKATPYVTGIEGTEALEIAVEINRIIENNPHSFDLA